MPLHSKKTSPVSAKSRPKFVILPFYRTNYDMILLPFIRKSKDIWLAYHPVSFHFKTKTCLCQIYPFYRKENLLPPPPHTHTNTHPIPPPTHTHLAFYKLIDMVLPDTTFLLQKTTCYYLTTAPPTYSHPKALK